MLVMEVYRVLDTLLHSIIDKYNCILDVAVILAATVRHATTLKPHPLPMNSKLTTPLQILCLSPDQPHQHDRLAHPTSKIVNASVITAQAPPFSSGRPT